MADLYQPDNVPNEYDPAWLSNELARIAGTFEEFEIPHIVLVPQNVAPTKLFEGMIVNADGTNWNPGSGAGLYEYIGSAWNKL